MSTQDEADQTILRHRLPDAVAPIAHALLLQENVGAARRIDLTDLPLTIGRAPTNGLVLSSPDISRQHCCLTLAGDAVVLTDLRSTNGVYVDGVRAQDATRLHPRARIAIGPYSLVYQRGSAAELQAAEREAREQARAVSYVRALLPAPLHQGNLRAEWRFEPSAQLGGDAFGYRWLDEARFALFLLDVSGHGIGSALLAASAANTLRGRVLGADPADPVAVLRATNAAFQMEDHDGLFFSLWYGVFDHRSRRLSYASAGHHPAYLLSGSKLAPLATRGPCIGMMPAARFEVAETHVVPSASLYLFSDGAFEVTRADGRPGEIGDLLALLTQERSDRSEPDRLFDAIRDLTGRRPFDDDVCLMTLEFQ